MVGIWTISVAALMTGGSLWMSRIPGLSPGSYPELVALHVAVTALLVLILVMSERFPGRKR